MTTTPAAEAADPTTPQARLAELAQLHPELRATIAANPACYPGLRDWIASVAPVAAQPASPFAASPAASNPFAAAAVARPVSSGKSRKPLFIGLAAALVILLVGGGVAVALVFSKFGGASSPEAAVQKTLDAVKNMDPVALYGSLSPAELGSFSAAIDELKGSAVTGDDGQTDYAALLQELAAVTEIEIENLEFEVDEIAEGVAEVTFTDGEFTMDTDTEVMAKALTAATADTYRANQQTWDYSDSEIDDMIDSATETAEDSLDRMMPIEFDADDVEDTLGFELSLITVQEGGSWYLSPILSYLEYMRDGVNVYGEWDLGELPDDSDIARFESPEDAVAGLLDGGEALVSGGDWDDLIAALPLAERRAVALYASESAFMQNSSWHASWDDLELSSESSGGLTLLELESLSITIGDDYEEMHLELEGVCADWQMEYNSGSGCLDDVSALDELGIADARIVVVQENGGWFVSALQTGGYISSILASNYAQLAADGDLDKLGN